MCAKELSNKNWLMMETEKRKTPNKRVEASVNSFASFRVNARRLTLGVKPLKQETINGQ